MLCFPMLISSLPGANPLPPEHKIGVFVRFWGLKPSFPGISSTKSRFLCFFALRNRRFQAFRAQNRGFCALFAFGTPVFRLPEHKIGIFVRFGGATAGATARSNGSNESNRSYRSYRSYGSNVSNGSNGSNGSNESNESNRSYGNNQSNGNNRSNRNDGRESLVADILSQGGVV